METVLRRVTSPLTWLRAISVGMLLLPLRLAEANPISPSSVEPGDAAQGGANEPVEGLFGRMPTMSRCGKGSLF